MIIMIMIIITILRARSGAKNPCAAVWFGTQSCRLHRRCLLRTGERVCAYLSHMSVLLELAVIDPDVSESPCSASFHIEQLSRRHRPGNPAKTCDGNLV